MFVKNVSKLKLLKIQKNKIKNDLKDLKHKKKQNNKSYKIEFIVVFNLNLVI
jgi:hypothetical protein